MIQEERDHYFGRLFGTEAIIKSSILFDASESNGHWEQVLDIIYEVAKKKPWLREECGWILYGAVQLLDRQNCDPNYARLMIDRLCSNGLAKTPEGLSLWLSIKSSFPTVNLPKGIWRQEDPLDIKERLALAKVLKEASEPTESRNGAEGNHQKGMWNSKLHFAWDIILAHFFERQYRDPSKPSKRLNFHNFWVDVVDGMY